MPKLFMHSSISFPYRPKLSGSGTQGLWRNTIQCAYSVQAPFPKSAQTWKFTTWYVLCPASLVTAYWIIGNYRFQTPNSWHVFLSGRRQPRTVARTSSVTPAVHIQLSPGCGSVLRAPGRRWELSQHNTTSTPKETSQKTHGAHLLLSHCAGFSLSPTRRV